MQVQNLHEVYLSISDIEDNHEERDVCRTEKYNARCAVLDKPPVVVVTTEG